MSLSVKNYYGGVWVDVSDYVTGAGTVPYISRNRDWTGRIDSWDLTIAGTIIDVRTVGYRFSIGDRFAVYNGTTILYCGSITSSEYDYDSQTFKINTETDLSKLKNYLVEYSVLHTPIVNNSTMWYEYQAADFYNFKNVGVLYLLRVMFLTIGATLDVSRIDGLTLFHDYRNGFAMDVHGDDLFLDEEMIYAIGASVATNHQSIDLSYGTSKKNFWEVFLEILSYLKLGVMITAVNSYILYETQANYTVADDDVYAKTEEPFLAEVYPNELGLDVSYKGRDFYQSGTITALDHWVSGGSESISLLSNLVIQYASTNRTTAYNLQTLIFRPQLISLAIVSASYAANEVTITTEYYHGFKQYDFVNISGVVGMTDINGRFEISAVVSSKSFKIAVTTIQTYTSGGVIVLANSINCALQKCQAKNKDYTRQTIECPIKTTISTVVENFIDLEEQTSKIIQETY